MKANFRSPDHVAQIPYRTPEIEATELGPQFFLCASSRNGDFENWTHNSSGYNNEDFD